MFSWGLIAAGGLCILLAATPASWIANAAITHSWVVVVSRPVTLFEPQSEIMRLRTLYDVNVAIRPFTLVDKFKRCHILKIRARMEGTESGQRQP